MFVAFARLAGATLTGTLTVAGTDGDPGSALFKAGEAVHVDPKLSHHRFTDAGADAGYRVQLGYDFMFFWRELLRDPGR